MKKAINENTTVELSTLRECMNMFPNVTLADLATATDSSVNALRARAKAPIPGEVYDPSAINYEAVYEYLVKRNPEFNINYLPWETMNQPKERARKPLRKDSFDYTPGRVIHIKQLDDSDWRIIFSTETHVVICRNDGTDSTPRCFSKETFFARGITKSELENHAETATENQPADTTENA